VYATVSSANTYDIMLSDGASKDSRVARIKVDSVFFSDVSAKLSTDGSHASFRVSGDRRGGSSIYVVNVPTGKYEQVALSKTSAEAIGTYAWSPAGNTMAYTRFGPASDPADVDEGYGTVYLFSVGFKAVKLPGSLGADRLLGFSSNGLGVYIARREGSGAEALEHLIYLPLDGSEGRLVLRSRPEVRFSRFAVWSQPGSEERVAALVEGIFGMAIPSVKVPPVVSTPDPVISLNSPTPTRTPPPASKVPISGKLSRPNGLGVMVSNVNAPWPVLLRRDAEAFTYLGWTPDGSGLLAGGTRSGASWVVGLDGSRRAANTPLRDMSAVASSSDRAMLVLADTPVTRLVTLNHATGGVAATRYVGAKAKAGGAAIQMKVPYIHQVKDTAENANGSWACGPTSLVMSLAYFGRLEPWAEMMAAERIGTPDPAAPPALPKAPQPVTGADFAPYVTNKYSAYGRSYASVARDPSGNMIAGLYGTICPTGLASWPQMISVLESHGLKSQFVAVTWDGVVAALKRGHPVLLGNMLTSDGHILLVIGHTNDGNLIVHDPYGNKFAPGYGGNDGNAVLYPWKRLTPRRALEVIGTYPPPTPTPIATATPTHTAVPTFTPTAVATP
jgi:hypothetical protein